MAATKANVLLAFSKKHNKLKEELVQFNWTKRIKSLADVQQLRQRQIQRKLPRGCYP